MRTPRSRNNAWVPSGQRVTRTGNEPSFLSTISHELRTPLTSIAGYVEMMRDGEAGDVVPMQRQMLDVVARNTQRLRDLIEDVLILSRIESGTLRTERMPVGAAFSAAPIACARRGTVSDEDRERSTVQAFENARTSSAGADASSTGGSGASPFPPFFDPLLLVAGFTFDMSRTLVEACFRVSRNDSSGARIRGLPPPSPAFPPPAHELHGKALLVRRPRHVVRDARSLPRVAWR